MKYTVKDISGLTGLTPYTIRYYCSIGFFDDVERTQGNVRLFSDADVYRFLFIECMKKTGMSLDEIREYMALVRGGDSTMPLRVKLMERQEENLENQIRQLSTMLDYLRYKKKLFEYNRHTIEGLPEELKKDFNPEKIQHLKERFNELLQEMTNGTETLPPLEKI